METDEITREIIGSSIAVHRALGPGLLESAYKACLSHELVTKGFRVELEKPLPICYRGLKLECGYRLDMVVENRVIVEVKSVIRLDPIFLAQVITYLKLSGFRVGLLINFNVRNLTSGLRRIVNNYPD